MTISRLDQNHLDEISLGLVQGDCLKASLLKDIILGKNSDLEVPANGIKLQGITVIGDLDFRGCKIKSHVSLLGCNVFGRMDFTGASTKDIVLKGTTVQQLILTDIRCRGSIVLSYGFSTLAPVWAMGAQISGQLGCSGGSFRGHPVAISLERADIGDAFFWRQIKGLWGLVDLTSAKVGTLVDDPDSWPREGNLRLDGFVYSHLGSNTSTDYFNRLPWLQCQIKPHLTYDFRTHPFEQLIKVLHNSGREQEAVEIAIQKLHFQRRANYQRRDPKYVAKLARSQREQNQIKIWILEAELSNIKPSIFRTPFLEISSWIKWLKSFLFWVLSGYGYRPSWCLYWGLFFIILGSIFLSSLYDSGNIVPSSPILLAREWKDAASMNYNQPYSKFFALVPDYPKFYSLGFALDAFIPLVDLGQEKNWVVLNRNQGNYDYFQPLLWGYICFGWIISAIFAASVSGVVRR